MLGNISGTVSFFKYETIFEEICALISIHSERLSIFHVAKRHSEKYELMEYFKNKPDANPDVSREINALFCWYEYSHLIIFCQPQVLAGLTGFTK